MEERTLFNYIHDRTFQVISLGRLSGENRNQSTEKSEKSFSLRGFRLRFLFKSMIKQSEQSIDLAVRVSRKSRKRNDGERQSANLSNSTVEVDEEKFSFDLTTIELKAKDDSMRWKRTFKTVKRQKLLYTSISCFYLSLIKCILLKSFLVFCYIIEGSLKRK